MSYCSDKGKNYPSKNEPKAVGVYKLMEPGRDGYLGGGRMLLVMCVIGVSFLCV